MTGPMTDFAELIQRARAGDPGAILELARRYEPEVRLVARLRLGPALRPYLDSVDLVQSVHRSLMLGLQTEQFEFSRPEQVVALALTMVRRKAAHAWRKLRRQQRLETEAAANLPELLVNLTAQAPDPAQQAEFEDSVNHMCRGLDPLDKKLLERNLAGYRTTEIAAELGLNADVLRVRLSRLRLRLRAAGVADELL